MDTETRYFGVMRNDAGEVDIFSNRSDESDPSKHCPLVRGMTIDEMEQLMGVLYVVMQDHGNKEGFRPRVMKARVTSPDGVADLYAHPDMPFAVKEDGDEDSTEE